MISTLIILLFIRLAGAYEEYFDNEYYSFAKDDSLAAFGYDFGRVCSIRKIGSTFYADLLDAYSVFKTPYTKLDSIDPNAKIENCFSYKATSYIISSKENMTSIMRGRLTKTFKLPKYEKLMHDHLSSKHYSLNNNVVSEVNMSMLENFWLIRNYTEHNLTRLFTRKNPLLGKIYDIFVFNNTIYLIRLKRSGKYGIYKQKIGEIMELPVSDTEETKFDFIPFVQIARFLENNPKNKLSIGSLTPTFVVPLPSSTIKPNQELSTLWILSLYTLDVIFVLIMVYVIREIFKYSKIKLEQNNNDISLASLP